MPCGQRSCSRGGAGAAPASATHGRAPEGLPVGDQALQLLLALQVDLLPIILPWIGTPLSFIYSCWLSSLYCFEYSWINTGLPFGRRLDAFESHWAYFLGFGLPFTAATFFLPFLIGSAVYALVFPVYVIVATAATPVPSPALLFGTGTSRLPICSPAREITNALTRSLRRRRQRGRKM